MKQPVKITHLITSLDTGGAERMLYQLVSATGGSFQQRVISLIPIGSIGQQIQALGIPVASLDMRPGRPSLRAFLRLARILRRDKPQILQTWLYHADLLGLLAGKMTGVPVIFWNIRNSNMDFARYRRLSGLVVRTCALLSRFPQGVVVNSRAGQAFHMRLGYRPRFWKFIPNGVDMRVFHPDPERRADLRRELGLKENTPLIGMVARYDPMKGHDVFLEAAGRIARKEPSVHFLLAGHNADTANPELSEYIKRNQLAERVHLLGLREDVATIHAALDILVSASKFGEGFSNVIAEAMACGVPCVVTDVGDSGRIVGKTGVVVPPGDPSALAEACLNILNFSNEERKRLGNTVRTRVVDHFGMQAAFDDYESLYLAMGQKESKSEEGV